MLILVERWFGASRENSRFKCYYYVVFFYCNIININIKSTTKINNIFVRDQLEESGKSDLTLKTPYVALMIKMQNEFNPDLYMLY